ncbi:hypothetical protein EIN_140860, partial [Entamoeba invadens IP1]
MAIRQLLILTIALFLVIVKTEVLCSPGCINGCSANYTCAYECKEGYDDDNTCDHCERTNQYDYSSPVYLQNDDLKCVKFAQKVEKNELSDWLPAEEHIEEIYIGKTKELTLDSNSYVDFSFCYYRQKYRQGKWFKMDVTKIQKDHISIEINKTDSTDEQVDLFVDGTNSQYYAPNPFCFIHFFSNKTNYNTIGRFPFVIREGTDLNQTIYYYFFANIRGHTNKLSCSLTFKEDDNLQIIENFNIKQDFFNELSMDLTKKTTLVIPFEQIGYYAYSACMPSVFMKAMLFTLEYKGRGYVFIDTRAANRVVYLNQLYMEYADDGNVLERSCKKYSVGKKLDIELSREDDGNTHQGNGIHVRLDNTTDRHYLSFLSENYRVEIKMTLSIICPNDCNAEKGFGRCDTELGECVCKNGYGGDDCHLLCYYNNIWQIPAESNLCYFGSKDCDQYCQCTNGKSVNNHMCVTAECRNGDLGYGDECKLDTEGCDGGCHCDDKMNYSSYGGVCVSGKCGNGKIDKYYESNGKYIRTEECDGGVNCNIICQCIEGFITSPDDPFSCI